jgi:multidrug efflux pump subunit AcrA (membrane-fusion protein)
MQLDPQDLQLSQAQALANLRAAETNRDLAKAELQRYQELRSKSFVSQAVLDAKESTYKAAQANVDAAQAGLSRPVQPGRLCALLADVDGVVTAVDAEVGQVVAAGTPVVRVAKSGEKEIVIGIPEDKVDSLRRVPTCRCACGPIRKRWRARSAKFRRWPMPPPAPTPSRSPFPIAGRRQAGHDGRGAVRLQDATPQIKVPLTALFYESRHLGVAGGAGPSSWCR